MHNIVIAHYWGSKDASHFPFSGPCTLVHLCYVRSALRISLLVNGGLDLSK